MKTMRLPSISWYFTHAFASFSLSYISSIFFSSILSHIPPSESIYLLMYLFIYLSFSKHLPLFSLLYFIYLFSSILPHTSPSLSTYLSIYLPIYLFIYLFTYLFIYLSTYQCASLLVSSSYQFLSFYISCLPHSLLWPSFPLFIITFSGSFSLFSVFSHISFIIYYFYFLFYELNLSTNFTWYIYLLIWFFIITTRTNFVYCILITYVHFKVARRLIVFLLHILKLFLIIFLGFIFFYLRNFLFSS